MKTRIYALLKYLALLSVLAVISSLTACNMPFKIVPNDMEENHPSGEEPFIEEEQPRYDEEEPFEEGEEPHEEGEPFGEMQIEFEAERTHLSPGQCTMLWWQAEGGGSVSLNGEPVEHTGEMEVCLEERDVFFLEVETEEGMESREIEFLVEGEPEEPGEEPPPDSPPPPPPPPSPSPSGNNNGNNGSNNGSNNNGNSGGAFSADFAITDLYITKNVNGDVVARVTNHGPGKASKVNFELVCSATETAYVSGAMTIYIVPWTVPINKASIDAGQTKEYNLNYKVDTTKQKYTVDCTVNTGWQDKNMGNNSYNEPFPPPP